MSYCPKTRSSNHAASCYTVQRICSIPAHTHDWSPGGSCFTKDGVKKCKFAQEHEHSPGAPCHSPIGPNCGGD